MEGVFAEILEMMTESLANRLRRSWEVERVAYQDFFISNPHSFTASKPDIMDESLSSFGRDRFLNSQRLDFFKRSFNPTWSRESPYPRTGRTLPLGYRFSPTDSELVHYLKLKSEGRPLPNCRQIVEMEAAELYGRDPFELSSLCYGHGGNRKRVNTLHVLTKKIRSQHLGKMWKAGTECGYWKQTSRIAEEIVDFEKLETVGFKTSLAYISTTGRRSKYTWAMKEHSLPPTTQNQHRNQEKVDDADGMNDADDMDDEWVICKIMRKKNKKSWKKKTRTPCNPAHNQPMTESNLVGLHEPK